MSSIKKWFYLCLVGEGVEGGKNPVAKNAKLIRTGQLFSRHFKYCDKIYKSDTSKT